MSSSSQARQRINALLDENSFVEIGALVTARNTDFNLKQEETPSDGVVTGYGVIDGNLVYVYSQDASVLADLSARCMPEKSFACTIWLSRQAHL